MLTVVYLLYLLVLLVLAIFGAHRYFLLHLYYRNGVGAGRVTRQPLPEPPPKVTVQLPLFNERFVAERLIRAVAAMEYPPEALEIQVLDDSTDDTPALIAPIVEELAQTGLNIRHIHRENRRGFKAGALEEGLHAAEGEFIAIFDADFVPPKSFLMSVIPAFKDSQVGMVQTRWAHLNRPASLLTRTQAILLDGHFVLEHGSRFRSGRFFNFNGTAGVFRKTCIQDAGGWQHDTLTEDLDLSYRAQLKGWKFVFLQDVEAPAELPEEVNAFKTQQHRWTKGAMQTARKLLRQIWRETLPLPVKMEATFHLVNNLAYPLMLTMVLLLPVVLAFAPPVRWSSLLAWDLLLLLFATGSVSTFYVCSQRELGQPLRSLFWELPVLLAMGTGICINNTIAVLEAFQGSPGEFLRTPKGGGLHMSLLPGGYRGRRGWLPVGELFLGVYLAAATLLAVIRGFYLPVPFLILFSGGFLFIGSLSLWQGSGKKS